jgi:hypothetical protein
MAVDVPVPVSDLQGVDIQRFKWQSKSHLSQVGTVRLAPLWHISAKVWRNLATPPSPLDLMI